MTCTRKDKLPKPTEGAITILRHFPSSAPLPTDSNLLIFMGLHHTHPAGMYESFLLARQEVRRDRYL